MTRIAFPPPSGLCEWFPVVIPHGDFVGRCSCSHQWGNKLCGRSLLRFSLKRLYKEMLWTQRQYTPAAVILSVSIIQVYRVRLTLLCFPLVEDSPPT